MTKVRAIVIGILLLAVFFRFFQLTNTPNGFHVDEIDASYVGRYIYQWGRDIYGNAWPITFDKFGDFRAIGIFYVSGFFTYIFGMNIFATRFASSLASVGSVCAIYFLGSAIFSSTIAGILAALALALMPWEIVLARSTSEGIVGSFCLTFGLALLFSAWKKHNVALLISGYLVLLVSYFFYHPYRLLGPMITIGLAIEYWVYYRTSSATPVKLKTGLFEKYAVRIVIGSVVVSLCITGLLSMSTVGSGRFSQVAFYKNPLIPMTIARLEAAVGANNVLAARVFHNKGVLYAREFVSQYVSFFSPSFLLFNGGLPDRYVVPQVGALSYWIALFFLVGLMTILPTSIKKGERLFVLFLLVIAPLPAALTYEDMPNMQRAVFLTIPIALLAGFGGSRIYAWMCQVSHKKRIGNIIGVILASIFFCVIAGEAIFFWHHYQVIAPSHRSFYRNDGNIAIMQEIYAMEKNYDQIVVPDFDELPIYYLFFKGDVTTIHPGIFKKKMEIDHIGKLYFLPTLCPSKEFDLKKYANTKVLIIDQGDCGKRGDIHEIRTLVRRDSTNAFRISDNSQ